MSVARAEQVAAAPDQLRVLAVLPDPPVLEGGAAGRCAAAMLQGLQQHSLAPTVLTPRRRPVAPVASLDRLPVEFTDAPIVNGWRGRLNMLTRPCGELSRGAFGARVRELAASADVLYLDQVQAGWCNVDLATPAVVNIHYLVLRDQELRFGRELPSVVVRRLGERAAMRRYRVLLANSPVVAGEIRRAAPGHEVVVVPLTLDPSHYRRAAFDGPPVAGFIGTAAWPPTAAAVRRLVTRVWPLVRRARPDARLRLAGRGMDRLGLPETEGVEVSGEVPSAARFLEELSLLLYPLGYGSGMKVKVLEALAVGIPTVTTVAGAEGIDGGDGVIVCERGSDEQAAREAVELLGDPAALRQRGAAAHEAFRSRYVPEVAVAPLVEVLGRLGASRG